MRELVCAVLLTVACIGCFDTLSSDRIGVADCKLSPLLRVAWLARPPLRLRGGSEWHLRISNETVHAVENSSIVRDWCAQFENLTVPENATEDEEEIERPFIQMDTLLFMLKMHRDNLTDQNGNLVSDPYTESFLPNASDIDPEAKKPLAVWVNTKMNTRCMLLRGECVGVGGTTLAQYVTEHGVITDDQEDEEAASEEVPTCHRTKSSCKLNEAHPPPLTRRRLAASPPPKHPCLIT